MSWFRERERENPSRAGSKSSFSTISETEFDSQQFSWNRRYFYFPQLRWLCGSGSEGLEKESLRNANGRAVDGLFRSSSDPTKQTTSSNEFVLQLGNRKRLRCMKVQAKNDPGRKTTVCLDRQIFRTTDSKHPLPINTTNSNGNGYLNLRQRHSSPPSPQRALR